jgi:hypothetical protein
MEDRITPRTSRERNTVLHDSRREMGVVGLKYQLETVTNSTDNHRSRMSEL